MEQSSHQPGDAILDRYMPDASPNEREEARRRLFAFVRVLVEIAVEDQVTERGALDSQNPDRRLTLRGQPPTL